MAKTRAVETQSSQDVADQAEKVRKTEEFKDSPRAMSRARDIPQPYIKVIDQRPNTAGLLDTQALREAASSLPGDSGTGTRTKIEAFDKGRPVATIENSIRGTRHIVTCPCGSRPTSSDDNLDPCEVCGKLVIRITS